MSVSFRKLLRQAVLCAALTAGDASMAAPKDNQAGADCLQKASIQFSIDNAQCSAYPPSEARNVCLAQATMTYSLAIQSCSSSASSARDLRTTRAPKTTTLAPSP